MVKRIREDDVYRRIGPHQVVKIAVQDILILRARIEIQPHGEAAEREKGPHLGPEACPEAQDTQPWPHVSAGLQAGF
jgi:hypothetical protein